MTMTCYSYPASMDDGTALSDGDEAKAVVRKMQDSPVKDFFARNASLQAGLPPCA